MKETTPFIVAWCRKNFAWGLRLCLLVPIGVAIEPIEPSQAQTTTSGDPFLSALPPAPPRRVDPPEKPVTVSPDPDSAARRAARQRAEQDRIKAEEEARRQEIEAAIRLEEQRRAAAAARRPVRVPYDGNIKGLVSSVGCEISNPPWRAPLVDPRTIIMKNDGGWCWVVTRFAWNGQYSTWGRIYDAPANGEAVFGAIDSERTRVAYRPRAGFVGSDSFRVMFGAQGTVIEFRVTVTAP